MLRMVGQTAGPIGLNFFVDTQGWPGGVNFFFKYIFQKYFSNFFQLVIKYNRMILLKKMNEHKRGIGNKLLIPLNTQEIT